MTSCLASFPSIVVQSLSAQNGIVHCLPCPDLCVMLLSCTSSGSARSLWAAAPVHLDLQRLHLSLSLHKGRRMITKTAHVGGLARTAAALQPSHAPRRSAEEEETLRWSFRGCSPQQDRFSPFSPREDAGKLLLCCGDPVS